MVCSPVVVGGLGIKDIGCFNDALIAKWSWRYRMSEVGLWRDILEARYRNWRNMNVTLIHRKQSLWWKDLCKISGREIQGNWFDYRTHWLLANGRSVKFWEDRWVDGQVLKEKFPRLFTISQCKDNTVGDLVDPGQIRSGGCHSWNRG